MRRLQRPALAILLGALMCPAFSAAQEGARESSDDSPPSLEEHEHFAPAQPRVRRHFGFGRTGAYFHRDGDAQRQRRRESLPRYRSSRSRGLRLSIGVGSPYFGYPYSGYGYDGYPYERLWYDNLWSPGVSLQFDQPTWYEYGYPHGFSYDDYGDDGYYRGGVRRSETIRRGPNAYTYGPVDGDDLNDERSSPAPSAAAREVYREQAFNAFRQRRYDQVSRHARHALVESPEDGLLHLLIAQAQFAQRDYRRAAETLHVAVAALPEKQWGGFVANYRDYYATPGEYTQQLRELERFAKDNPTEPFASFLLGYHYGYLGYPDHAVRELQKAVELAQADSLPERLLEMFSQAKRAGAVEPAAAGNP